MSATRNWDPATDPIRGAYPDKWHLEFGQEALQITDRLMADSGADQTAITFYATGRRRSGCSRCWATPPGAAPDDQPLAVRATTTTSTSTG